MSPAAVCCVAAPVEEQMCLPQHTAGCLFHKKPPPHRLRQICPSDGDGTQQVGGLEGRAEGIVRRSVVDVNVSMGCWK